MRYTPGSNRRPSKPHQSDSNIVRDKIHRMRESAMIYLESMPAFPYDIDTLYGSDGVSIDGQYFVNCIKPQCLPDEIVDARYSCYILFLYEEDSVQYQILMAGTRQFVRHIIPAINSRNFVWSAWVPVDANGNQLYSDYVVIDEGTGETLTDHISSSMISVDTMIELNQIPIEMRAHGRLIRVANTDTEEPVCYYTWDAKNSVWQIEPINQNSISNIGDVPGLTDSIVWKTM